MTDKLSEADAVVVPGYTYTKCDVPGGCSTERSWARLGDFCYHDGTALAAYWRLRAEPELQGRLLVLWDALPRIYPAPHLPDTGVYRDPRYIWAADGARKEFFRPGVDISIPCEPTPRCSSAAARRAFLEPRQAKRYFASYKGKLRYPTRETVARLFHDGNQVVVVDRLDPNFDYDELLFSSAFNLVMGGDTVQAFRFNEAVCSGGVPVLISSHWVPPFDTLTPFDTYGIQLNEEEVPALLERLRACGPEEWERLRENARRACGAHFATSEVVAASIAEHLVRPRRRGRSSGAGCPGLVPGLAYEGLGLVRRPHEAADPAAPGPPMPNVETNIVGCPRRIYPLSFAEAEHLAPSLGECFVSTYAARLQKGLAAAPCTTPELAFAAAVIVPGYTAIECNWPEFSTGDCCTRGCVARAGRFCHLSGKLFLEALRQLQTSPEVLGKDVVVVTASEASGSPPVLDWVGWAAVGAAAGWYRPAVDVSLPAAPSAECATQAAARASLEPLEGKPRLLSWKGDFSKNPLARRLAALHHNGDDVVLVDASEDGPGSTELRQTSVFSLIIGVGPVASRGFNEAVCSGGIPVLVADDWVAPFQQLFPFEVYGIRVSPAEGLAALVELLRELQLDRAARELQRQSARRVCTLAFQSLEVQAVALASSFIQPEHARLDGTFSAVISDVSVPGVAPGTVFMSMSNGLVYTAVAPLGRGMSRLWIVASTGYVFRIALDGDAIYGIKADLAVYWQVLSAMSPRTAWVPAFVGSVWAIAVHGGTIYGVGSDNAVYRQGLDALGQGRSWQLASSALMASIAVLPGTIYGLSTDGRIYKQALASMNASSPWAPSRLTSLPGDARALL